MYFNPGKLLCVLLLLSGAWLVPIQAQDKEEKKEEKKEEAKALFPDKNLEAVVRREVFEKRNKKDPLTKEDVVNISSIGVGGYGRGKKIKSLQGLEACRSLRALELPDNEIEDLSAIQELKYIQTITLSGNKIKNIGPLGKLTALQYINIEKNQVADLKPLETLKNLRNLYADENTVKDLAPLAGLDKMVSIYLKNNQVTDLKPLAKLKWLERLDVSGNGLTDVSALAGLTEWRYLFLHRNKITDLSILIEMAQKDKKGDQRFAPFWNLYLADNPLSDAAKGKQLEELKKVARTVDLKYNR